MHGPGRLHCGLRLGELAGLRRAQVDQANGTIRVIENAVEVKGQIARGAPKTSAGRRTVPVAPTVATELERHLATFTADSPDGPVFAGALRGTLRAGTWRTRFWFPAIEAAGIEPLRVHDMRHTAVALWITAGAKPKQIAAWAGHTSVAVVLDRYGHLFDGHEAEVLNRLDAFVRCSPAPTADDKGQSTCESLVGPLSARSLCAGLDTACPRTNPLWVKGQFRRPRGRARKGSPTPGPSGRGGNHASPDQSRALAIVRTYIRRFHLSPSAGRGSSGRKPSRHGTTLRSARDSRAPAESGLLSEVPTSPVRT